MVRPGPWSDHGPGLVCLHRKGEEGNPDQDHGPTTVRPRFSPTTSSSRDGEEEEVVRPRAWLDHGPGQTTGPVRPRAWSDHGPGQATSSSLRGPEEEARPGQTTEEGAVRQKPGLDSRIERMAVCFDKLIFNRLVSKIEYLCGMILKTEATSMVNLLEVGCGILLQSRGCLTCLCAVPLGFKLPGACAPRSRFFHKNHPQDTPKTNLDA